MSYSSLPLSLRLCASPNGPCLLHFTQERRAQQREKEVAKEGKRSEETAVSPSLSLSPIHAVGGRRGKESLFLLPLSAGKKAKPASSTTATLTWRRRRRREVGANKLLHVCLLI